MLQNLHFLILLIFCSFTFAFHDSYRKDQAGNVINIGDTIWIYDTYTLGGSFERVAGTADLLEYIDLNGDGNYEFGTDYKVFDTRDWSVKVIDAGCVRPAISAGCDDNMTAPDGLFGLTDQNNTNFEGRLFSVLWDDGVSDTSWYYNSYREEHKTRGVTGRVFRDCQPLRFMQILAYECGSGSGTHRGVTDENGYYYWYWPPSSDPSCGAELRLYDLQDHNGLKSEDGPVAVQQVSSMDGFQEVNWFIGQQDCGNVGVDKGLLTLAKTDRVIVTQNVKGLTFSFAQSIVQNVNVYLAVYDVMGKEVIAPVTTNRSSVSMNVNIPHGMYFAVLKNGNKVIGINRFTIR